MRSIPLLVAVLYLFGCASGATGTDGPLDADRLEPGIYDLSSGNRLTIGELAERTSTSRYVVFGEQHTSRWQHRRQAELFRRLGGRGDRRRALGMEMFQRPFQSALDAYVAGEIGEKQMLERTEWNSRWGVDPELYRPLWRRARGRGTPIAALNLRREFSRKIARVGLEGLSEEERSKVPQTVDTSNEAQRRYVREAFERHEMAGHMEFEHFLQAQAAWDETMAETAVSFLRDRKGVGSMFIVAGRAHARSDFGIPPRIERRVDRRDTGEVVSILPVTLDEDAGATRTRIRRYRRREAADYVWLERLEGE